MERLMWVDIETASINPGSHVMEIAITLTDFWLNEIASYRSTIYAPRESLMQQLSDWSRDHHQRPKYGNDDCKKSLVDLCADSAISKPINAVEDEIINFLMENISDRPKNGLPRIYMAGSSLHLDKSVIERQFPRLNSLVSHQLVDVTVLLILTSRWSPSVSLGKPPNTSDHTAAGDVRSSLELLRYYKQTLFMNNFVSKKSPPACHTRKKCNKNTYA
ncbi:exonuclease rnase t and dna polymerase iii, putative [Acanthamoeba castellanii str. Neff]|uniref:Exonuclease rnase t and dna polymerase iii, putative n=1 Tax=Acanthamoeba castellanii (strain ATCC 30010 / Neff) TaxID=1257118 RepID=L8GHF8_ACACF|nr:exonuclease rnase t and dna polymerase iii, putative [Acanthamoeba castellanii str. Neff]ELR12432.1 exonuclease rnase t and dna polymerase iii, putative [Acanthamoeba castellanii str. Neff]